MAEREARDSERVAAAEVARDMERDMEGTKVLSTKVLSILGHGSYYY
jgi:hypothetical protein